MPQKGVAFFLFMVLKIYTMEKEIIMYRNHKIEVTQDHDPIDTPNDWNDNRFIIYDHRDFCVNVKGWDCQTTFEDLRARHQIQQGYHVFPVYAYIHGGVVLSLGRDFPDDRWDVSFKGFALVKREKGTWKREQARQAAYKLIGHWNEYLMGDVWCVTTKYESVGNWYGDDKAIGITDAKDTIDYQIEKSNEKSLKVQLRRLRNWITNKVPFEQRKPLKLI